MYMGQIRVGLIWSYFSYNDSNYDEIIFKSLDNSYSISDIAIKLLHHLWKEDRIILILLRKRGIIVCIFHFLLSLCEQFFDC